MLQTWLKEDRFYNVQLQTNLFGGTSVFCSWGSRYGKRGGYKIIFCDSELIVRQINGDYKVKNERMIKLHAKVLDLCSMLNHWSVSHVLRDKNMEADLLSKEGLTK